MEKNQICRDIEQELQYLILKYDIARYIPRYRKYCDACKMIRQLETKLNQKKVTVIGSRKIDIERFADIWGNKSIHICEKITLDENIDFNMKPDVNEDAAIIFVSKKNNGKWMTYLRHHLAEKRILSLYDYLEEKGLFFSADYYDVFVGNRESNYECQDMSQIFFYDRCQYEQIADTRLRSIYLEKMIFDALYCKDFVTSKELINRFILERSGCERANEYIRFLEELQILLDDIKAAMKQNAKEDIFLFWIDAVSREEMDTLSFFHDKNLKAIFFDNAFTVTSNTKPTYRTLFHKMREISDKGYQHRIVDVEDSNLIQELNNLGYDFEVLGINMPIRNIDLLHTGRCCFSELCWDAIKKSLAGTRKTLYLLHEILHTHSAYGSMGNSGCYFSEDISSYPWIEKAPGLLRKRQQESLDYMDKQLFYWKSYLPKEAYKIYMSDHGDDIIWFEKFHTFMVIEQKDLESYHEKRIFSYYEFDKLLLSLLKKGKVAETIFQGWAAIENLPTYSEKTVTGILNSGIISITQLGAQGIITDKAAYWVLGNGQEIYLRMDGRQIPITEKDIQQVRETFQFQSLDLNESFFKYSKMMIGKYNWAEQKRKKKRIKINQILQEMAEQLDEKRTIAVRGGGLHTLIMLMHLPVLRKKVRYIIDLNTNAVAGKMGYEVLIPEGAWDKGIDILVLSSFDYRAIWKKEAIQAGISKIIDPYDLFEKNGIVCKADYYNAYYDISENADEQV